MRKTKKYKQFCDRYYSFRREDTVVLCPWHHCEIHEIYSRIIAKDTSTRKKPLSRYSWKQAFALMDRLKDTCLEWEEETTPGRNPELCGFVDDKD